MNSLPKIALIHGWAAPAEYWKRVNEELLAAGYVVKLHDLPGYGDRRQEDGALDLHGLVDDALEKLSDCDLWVGWSLGGIIALSAAARNPATLRGVMAVSATAKFCCNPEKEAALERLRSSVVANPRKAVVRFGLSMIPPAARRELSQHLADENMVSEENASHVSATLLAGLDILATADLTAEVNKIAIPVHLISGRDDEIVPLSSGQELHALIPDSQFTKLPCGHIPFWFCRERFMEKLFEFAQTIASSTAS